MIRLMLCDVPLKRRRRLVFAAFGFDGDDLPAALKHKVDLAVLIGVIARFDFKLSAKLLQNIVLRQRPLELVIRFQEDRAVVNACHVLEKAGIENKQLELIQLVECGQWMLHFRDIVNTIEYSG